MCTLCAWLGLVLGQYSSGGKQRLGHITTPTDRGGFLDVTLDFLFYASIPLAFAVAHPAQNALPAAVLLASFIGTGPAAFWPLPSWLAFILMNTP